MALSSPNFSTACRMRRASPNKPVSIRTSSRRSTSRCDQTNQPWTAYKSERSCFIAAALILFALHDAGGQMVLLGGAGFVGRQHFVFQFRSRPDGVQNFETGGCGTVA